MMLFALVSWWYGRAWSDLLKHVNQRLDRVIDFFSVGLLLKTLFDPFRQIAAGQLKNAPLADQMRAFGDRTFSRFVGAAVRSMFIFLGAIAALLTLVIGFVQLILWPCVPFVPVLAVAGWVLGWTL
jgi:hypothetical protein